MKYLVIGGAGFIGSNMVEHNINKGNEVIVCDNLHTGSLDNLESVMDSITFLQNDSGDLKASELEGIDGIYHMGIYSSSPMYKDDPSLVGRAVNEFINVLTLARELDVKLVWASTSSIYNGNPTPWEESMQTEVMDYYGEVRHYMERLAKLHHGWYGTKSVAMRFFSIYGHHEEAKKNFANLVSQFLWDMKKGKSPVLFGDGKQRRDFVFVTDVINALETAMVSQIEFDAFNVGTGISYDLNELVEILNEKLGTSIEPTYVENTIQGYVQETLADTKKAERVLGFKTTVSLSDGIDRLL